MPPCITSCNMGRPRLYNLTLWGLTKLPQYVAFLGRNKTHMLWLAGPWKAAKSESKKASAFLRNPFFEKHFLKSIS